MEKARTRMSERILNLTLEIVYLLTGEDYIIVKKPGDSGSYSRSPHVAERLTKSLSTVPQTVAHETNNDQKILELTNKIIQLLSGEVPIRFEDVTLYFSMEEWEFLEGHKDLYKDVMMETYQTLSSPDDFEDRRPLQGLSISTFIQDRVMENKKNSKTISEAKSQTINKPLKDQTVPDEALRIDENVVGCDMYTPTDQVQTDHAQTDQAQTDYPSIHSNEEFAFCEVENLTDTNTPTSEEDAEAEYPPILIKEDPASSDERNVAADEIDMPIEHPQTEYTSTYITDQHESNGITLESYENIQNRDWGKDFGSIYGSVSPEATYDCYLLL
ncbi:uncharacterized protein RCH25_008738 [Pelodytes ibericus]